MFCGQFRPIVGGAERQAESLARALVGRGCKVEVLTPRLDPMSPEQEAVDGVVVHRFALTDLTRRAPGWPGLGIPNLLIERLQTRRAVLARIGGFDLLHTHLASPLVAFAMDAAHAAGRPVLCKVACGGRDFDFESLRAASVLGRRLERGLVARMDVWVAISGEVRRNLLEAGVRPERIVSIPNGIDAAAFGPARVPGAVRRFLCLGRITKFDLETFFGAFDRLAAEHSDVTLAERREACQAEQTECAMIPSG